MQAGEAFSQPGKCSGAAPSPPERRGGRRGGGGGGWGVGGWFLGCGVGADAAARLLLEELRVGVVQRCGCAASKMFDRFDSSRSRLLSQGSRRS